MAKGTKKTAQKVTLKVKKQAIIEKLNIALSDYKELMGEKKFESAVKKASKLFLEEKKVKSIQKPAAIKKLKNKKEPKSKVPKAANSVKKKNVTTPKQKNKIPPAEA